MKKILEECTLYHHCLTLLHFVSYTRMYVRNSWVTIQKDAFLCVLGYDRTITRPTKRCGREGEVSSFYQHHWTVKVLYCLGNTAVAFILITQLQSTSSDLCHTLSVYLSCALYTLILIVITIKYLHFSTEQSHCPE